MELYGKGYPYLKIAKEVHLSLREVSKYVNRISNKLKDELAFGDSLMFISTFSASI